jgi:tRNA C32,U32 (ribose-2'-O)-methylase TrmJ
VLRPLSNPRRSGRLDCVGNSRNTNTKLQTQAKLRRLILRAVPSDGDVGLLRAVIDALGKRTAEEE